jgi:hypothetical protein
MTQTELPEVGTAVSCHGYGSHRPTPLRFVWHHILPRVCGGKTVTSNLVSVCDVCHYSIHIIMWQMANNVTPEFGSRLQHALAQQGYDAAVANGTTHLIPKEAD